MRSRMDLKDVETLVRATLEQHYPDLDEIEVRAFISGLVTTIGLAALNASLGDDRRTAPKIVDRFDSYNTTLDFVQLPRQELLRSLEASSGLRTNACDDAITVLEETIRQRIKHGTELEVESIGVFRMSDRHHLSLELRGSRRHVSASASNQL